MGSVEDVSYKLFSEGYYVLAHNVAHLVIVQDEEQRREGIAAGVKQHVVRCLWTRRELKER